MPRFACIQVSADFDFALGPVKPSPEGRPAERAQGLTKSGATTSFWVRLCVQGKACTKALLNRFSLKKQL